MLCVASIKAKSEVTFGLVQSVLTKLIKRHSSSANHSLSTRSLNFYVQHVNYEIISGRRRAVQMCKLVNIFFFIFTSGWSNKKIEVLRFTHLNENHSFL